MKVLEFHLKRVQMARHGLVLNQDEAAGLRIVLGPVLTPKSLICSPNDQQNLGSILSYCHTANGGTAVETATVLEPGPYASCADGSHDAQLGHATD